MNFTAETVLTLFKIINLMTFNRAQNGETFKQGKGLRNNQNENLDDS